MKRALSRRTQTGVRGQLVTRPQIEQLEDRLAAGSVLDVFGLGLAGPGLFGPSGESPVSEIAAADPAADQRPLDKQQSPSALTSWLPTPVAPQNPESSGSSTTAASPISFQESTSLLDPREGGIQDPFQAAADRMGMFNALLRGTVPTQSVAAGPGSAAKEGAANQSGNTSGGAFLAAPAGSTAGGGGASPSPPSGAGVSSAALAAPRPRPSSAGTVPLPTGTVPGTIAGSAAVADQQVTGNVPGPNTHASQTAGDVGVVVPGASSFLAQMPGAPPAIGQAPATSPINFVETPDPGNPTIRFVASSPSLTASFEEHAIQVQLGSQQQNLIRLAFEGASAESRLAGEGPASGTDGATFGGVRYTGLYDGIDVRVDDSVGELRYELFVAPGADVAQAMIHADEGAVKVEADGSLTIQAPGGTLRQTAPVSWDVLPGGAKRPLESHFRVAADGDYGFEVIGHDPTLPLVIDPTLVPAPALVGPASGASVTEPFNISWSSVTSNPSGVVAYNWQVSTSPTMTPVVFQDSVNSPTTQDMVSGLANGTYYWHVQAVDGAFDQGAWSETRSFTITGESPSAPGTPVLAPTQAYTTFHPLETGSTWWTPVAGAATYVWETSQGDPNFGWNNVFRQDNLDQTAFTFDMGFEGTFYSRVYAVSADGVRGAPSNVISYTYSYNNPIGPAPALLSPISGQTVSLPVTLQWAHVPNPQVFGYTIEIAKDPAFKNIELTAVQQHFPSVPITSLTPGTKYWRVFSTQGDSAPETVDSAGLPAVTAPSATGTFTVSTAPATPVSLAFEGFDAPQGVPGGTNFYRMALQLTAAAPVGGPVITLTSSNPAVAPVPATIAMPGFGWGDFQIPLGQVSVPTPVTITATLNGVSTTGRFTVLPTALKDITPSSPTLSGGSPAGAWIDLTGPAPAGGAVVGLSSDNSAAIVPSTMTLAAGWWSGSFLLTTTAVTATTVATITATYNGVSQKATVTLTPPRTPQSLTIDPISRIGSDPGTATGLVTFAGGSAYDQTFQLTSSNPAVASVPATVTATAGFLGGAFPITTSAVSATTVVTITATAGGVSRSVPFTVYPAGTKASLSSVRIDQASVTGGTAATGTVVLNSAAPAGGLVVALSDNSGTVTVPASVTVLAGATSATFPVTTSAVTATTTATISATLGTTQSVTLAVTPAPVPSLYFVSLTTQNVVGGASATGVVQLSAAALTDGAVVTLTSDSSAVTVPASVTVPADAVAILFPVATSAVTAATAVTITASYGGTTQFIRLNVNPPQAGPVLAGLTVTPTTVAGLTTATATVTLSAPAPAGGAAVFFTHTSLAVSQELLGINVIVPAGATSATFTVGTYKVSVPMVAGLRATYGGVTQTAMLTVNPTAAPTLSALTINPANVTGGTSSTGTVTLSAPAPAGGLVVTLSDNSAAVTVPASVTVAAGATSANFTIATTSVTASTLATISATAGGVTQSATLTVNPAPAVTLSTVGLNPTSVTGGKTSQGTVTLSGPAPSGGLVVTLASNNTAAATVPVSVTVPAGAISTTFTMTTSAVTASTSVLISATGGGVTRSATLTVTPAQTDTATVTKAEYTASKKVLLVEATSSSTSATLQVFATATNQLIGTLTNNGGGKYTGQFSWPTNPQNITVKSSLGGSASKAVTLK